MNAFMEEVSSLGDENEIDDDMELEVDQEANEDYEDEKKAMTRTV